MKILEGNNPTLLTKCIPVKKHILSNLKYIIDDMFETMKNNNGIGLAANQVGYGIQLFIMEYKDVKHVIINPEVINKSEEMVFIKEGCLSHPDQKVDKLRHIGLTLKYLDDNGDEQEARFTGMPAVIVQHEMDHLNGIDFLGDNNGTN